MMDKTKDMEEVHVISEISDLETQGLAMVAWQIYWAGSNPANSLDKELVEKAGKYLHQILDSKTRVTH